MVAVNIPLLTWCVIVASMLTLFIVKLVRLHHHDVHHPLPHHIVEVGSEREEMYVPGDREIDDKTLNDDTQD